jgi:hypothetical protein
MASLGHRSAEFLVPAIKDACPSSNPGSSAGGQRRDASTPPDIEVSSKAGVPYRRSPFESKILAMARRLTPQETCVTASAAVLALLAGAVLGIKGSQLQDVFPLAVGGFLILALTTFRAYAKRGDAFGMMPFVAGFYLLAFGVGSIYYYAPGSAQGTSALHGYSTSYSTDGLIIASGIALIGLASWMTGFITCRFVDVAYQFPRPRISLEEIPRAALVLFAFGWLIRVLFIHEGLYFRYSTAAETAGSFTTLLAILVNLPLVATALVGIARYHQQKIGQLYWLLILLEIGYAIPSGVRAKLISIGLLVIVVRYYSTPRGTFPWRILTVGLLLAIFVVFPFGALYRGRGGVSGYEQSPLLQITKATTTLTSQPANDVTLGAQETLSRFSDAASLATIVTQGRGRYPVQGTATIRGWVEGLFPRFLLPGKSDPGTLGNEFGRTYNLIVDKASANAAIAPSQVGDFYGSFGWLGVTAGLFFAGALYRLLDQYLRNRRGDAISLAIYAALIGLLVNRLETSFAIGYFQTFKEVIIFVLAIALGVTFTRKSMIVRPTSRHARDRTHYR